MKNHIKVVLVTAVYLERVEVNRTPRVRGWRPATL